MVVGELQAGWCYYPKAGGPLSPKLLKSFAVLQSEKAGWGTEEARNQDFPTPPSPAIILGKNAELVHTNKTSHKKWLIALHLKS